MPFSSICLPPGLWNQLQYQLPLLGRSAGTQRGVAHRLRGPGAGSVRGPNAQGVLPGHGHTASRQGC